MTAVEFHFNVPERLPYVCRLLRKAVRMRTGVAVTAAPEALDALDAALWRFDPIEFIPHLRVRAGRPPAARLHATPVWLVDAAADCADLPVLLNLGAAAPQDFQRYSRLIEVVTLDEADRNAARVRWKQYAALGHAIVRHEVPA